MAVKLLKAVILIPFCFLHCASPVKQAANTETDYRLGKIDFKASGSLQAQPHFDKGLLLLHSFEYPDAAEAFKMARQIDPGFIMAYWGEAMTHNHPLWRYQDYDKANAILKELAPTGEERVAKAKTELEKDFIRAANVLFGKGTKAERDAAYASFMESLYRKYNKEPEVASFYSLALIGSVQEGRDVVVFGKAADIAKEVLEKNPKHPGALHYLIHAYDDPDHALKALNTADAYAVTAPDAGHALHMPTHIYLALGMWDKVISSNIDSWGAEVKRKERKQLNNDALGYHSFHWLQYGYLQKGDFETAQKLLKEMRLYAKELPSGRARAHFIYMKSTYLAETQDWQSTFTSINPKTADLNITTRAMNHFVNGWYAWYRKDDKALSGIIQQLAGERLIELERVNTGGTAVCGSINSSIPTLLDVQYAEVMEMELKALQAWMKNDLAETEAWFSKATALENNISYSYGPPNVVKPSNELYAEWLVQQKRYREAVQQFELALKAAPNRTLSMNGKKEAEKRII